MQISYDHYRIFYYVAKYRSITAAAQVLMSNQPNVTRIIKTLEKDLGCTLFIRSRSGTTLTAEGERLFEHVKVAFEQIEAGEREISVERSLQNSVVSVGMIPKVECCIEALQKGVKNVIIMDGRVPHSILMEILTDEGAGTMVTEDK